MYTWKELMRAGLTIIGVMVFLGAFLTLNALHYAGVL